MRTHAKLKCKAKNKAGNRCNKWAISGAVVCRTHGGGAPQVKHAARMRLAMLVDPAIAVIAGYLQPHLSKTKGPPLPPSVRLAAAKDALDRNGFKPKDEIVLTPQVDQTNLANMTDEELDTLIRLAKKASTLRDIHDNHSGVGDDDE